MREVLTAAVIAILTCTLLPAAELALLISGPSTVTPGKLVTLELKGETKNVLWHVDGLDGTDWHPGDAPGSRLVFASLPRAGHYRFVAFGAAMAGDELLLGKAEFVVLCQESGPTPPMPPTPPPGPIPPPAPPPPAPTLGLKNWVNTEGKALVTPEARGQAKALAASFKAVRDTATSIAELKTATTAANQAAVGGFRLQWLPFFQELSRRLVALFEGGQMTDMASHKAAWTEIAEGLESW